MSNGKHTAVKVKDEDTKPLSTIVDYGNDAGDGFENHTSADYSVPFLAVIQSNSPIIENIPEARPGMLINTVTSKLYDAKKGVAVIPVYTNHTYVEWRPRAQGGGFVGTHIPSSDIVQKIIGDQEFGKYKMIKGDIASNDLIETFYAYSLLLDEDGSVHPAIIAFTSTKNKIYKNWMNQAKSIQIVKADGSRATTPLYSHRYRITSVGQKNAKGSFFNYQIKFDGVDAPSCRIAPFDPLYAQAKEFNKLAKGNEVKVAHETQTQETEVEQGETPFK